MHEELTNLLPSGRRKAVVRDYLLRLAAVTAWLVAVIAIVATVLLIPTYILLINSAQAKQNYLNSTASTVSSSEADSLTTQLATLNSEAGTLTALAEAPSASGVFGKLLAISRPGILLTNFTYTPASPGKAGTVLVAGTSATRDALRNYQLALQNAPFASSAALPVSAYAKDSDIPFTITLTLAP